MRFTSRCGTFLSVLVGLALVGCPGSISPPDAGPDSGLPDSGSEAGPDAGEDDGGLPDAGRYTFVGPKDSVGWPHQLVFDPAHSGVVYAGCDDTMGLYRSTDSGATWRPLAAYGSRSAWALAVDLTGRIYAGDAYGTGVFVSSDSGATFTARLGIDLPYMSSISAHPSLAGTAFASAGEDRNADGNGGTGTPLHSRGGLYETTNGGLSWTAVAGVPTDAPFLCVFFLPGNPNVVLAARATELWRSTDGGAHWTQHVFSGPIAGGTRVIGFVDFAAQAAGTRVLASVSQVDFVGSNATALYLIWRSDDAGLTWTPANSPSLAYAYSVMASPVLDAYFAFGFPVNSADPGVIASIGTDRGLWGAVPNAPLLGSFSGAFDPLSPLQLLVGTVGDGVYRFDGSQWTQSDQGMTGAACDGLAIDATSGRWLASCGNLSLDPVVAYSDDRGGHWTRIRPPGLLYSGIGQNLVIPALADREQSGTFLLGGDAIRRSEDNAQTWAVADGGYSAASLTQGPDGTVYAAAGTGVVRSLDHGISFADYGGLAAGAAEIKADPLQAGRRVFGTARYARLSRARLHLGGRGSPLDRRDPAVDLRGPPRARIPVRPGGPPPAGDLFGGRDLSFDQWAGPRIVRQWRPLARRDHQPVAVSCLAGRPDRGPHRGGDAVCVHLV